MLNKFKKLDWPIIIILGIFMVISIFVIKSATFSDPKFVGSHFKMMYFYIGGFAIMLGVSLVDYRLLLKGWIYFYGLGVALLIAVFFLGAKINGAVGWFKLPGGLQFQPAELMKLAIIVMVAYLMGRRTGDPLRFRGDVIPIGFLTFIPFLLVLIQPDLGNAIIYVVILLGMFWIGNVRYTHVVIGLGAVLAAMFLFVFLFNTFNQDIKDYLQAKDKIHWYQRINTFMNPDSATEDEKHQSNNAMIAIGSGGLTGEGYMQSESIKKKFVPYPYSDSIFVVIGEEFGFQGASVLLLLYFLLIYRMILIAFQCYDQRGAYIIIGIVSMFVFQIFENIGMMIGIMPITGITLPFISYGGTSLLLNMLCIGIVLSVKIYQEKYALED
ncbi:FtsW/RodA/SpoVE family cell cycle protein [Paenibacillus guangzhouensis]|uniref:FtsW/RodA/SpoVE family cell cycle protein n=1 Tax=Paenibacillus guangzhouensis TaxID=1473112 RepID=UPI001266DE62|nr:FtsW/RodA/SpoVE family cell cycle protein [Paenibacillus guangzhouensis]